MKKSHYPTMFPTSDFIVSVPYRFRIILLSFSYRSPIILLSFSYHSPIAKRKTIRDGTKDMRMRFEEIRVADKSISSYRGPM